MKCFKKRVAFWLKQRFTRRALLFLVGYCLVLSTALVSCTNSSSPPQQQATSPGSPAANGGTAQVFHVVRSKQLTALAALEKRGTLEKALQPLGFTVSWDEYAAGPQQLEALNAGNLDLASTAESPPVFAQAAGASLVYM
ncbi:MAG TPA: hypothetical protein V6C65_00015, partial [Allocoleopsis sp.]